MEAPFPYDPKTGIVDLTLVATRGHNTGVQVLGYPLKIWDDYRANDLCMLQCADDDGPTFHAAPGMYYIHRFHWVLNDYRMRHRMSNQLLEFDEVEHDRTGGPPFPPDTIGTPLQEQVELVEDALQKALAVIEALVSERQELANDVYQAQVDAQDWQNQYNELKRSPISHPRICDVEQIRELTSEVEYLREGVHTHWLNTQEKIQRIRELTEQNSQLELRNERQANRLAYARRVLEGYEDNQII